MNLFIKNLFLSMSMIFMVSSAMEEKPSDKTDETYSAQLDRRYSNCLKTCEFYRSQSKFFSKDNVEAVCTLHCLENYIFATAHEMNRNIVKDETKK